MSTRSSPSERAHPDPPRLSLFGWSLLHVLGCFVVVANLLASRDHGALLWALYGVTALCWCGYLALDYVEASLTWVPLAVGVLVCAPVEGRSADVTALVFVALFTARLASVPQLPGWSVPVLILAGAGIVVLGDVAAGRPERLLDRGTTVLVAGVLGFNLRQFRTQAIAARRLLEQTKATQHEQARAAALDERARIAREIHDVLAHSLGALGVQLEVAEAMLTEGGDVDAAARRVARAHRLAAEGLTEARTAVAALRGEVPPLADAIADLAAGHRRTHGTEVDCACEGTPRVLEAEVTVALLRTVREALTNAARHARGARVGIRLVFGSGQVRVRVHNEAGAPGAAAPGGGHGLAGIRERVALLGGTIEAGQDGDGWSVNVRVPA